MDEDQTRAWQAALVEALLATDDVDAVRMRLRTAVPWASAQIDAMDARAIAVAIDLVRTWSPQTSGRERG